SGHAYEEHLAAMKKYHADSGAAQKGKKGGKGKKGPGRGKGKETMAQAQEAPQIEGLSPDVQRFFQLAKDICGTMKEENRTMTAEEWAEVLAVSCPGNGCEDPEVFAAMREERMMPVEEEEDAPTFGGRSPRASPGAGTARAIRLMSSSAPLSQEELEEQKKLMAIFKKEHPGFDFSEVSEEDQRRLWNKTVPMNQWTEEQKKKKSERMKTVIWSRSSSSTSDLQHPVWNDPNSEMSRLIQKNSTEERSERSKMSESTKDIDEQAFWSPCQMKAPQDMVLRIAAQATGRQYGGYWTNPPLPEGEIQENQRMEAAVAAVKNRKEKEEKFQVLEEPLKFKSLPLEGPNPDVRRETARVKRKAQNLEGQRVRTESEPGPPRRHGRASGCTPYSGTARPLPLEPL
ncbi:MAG: hypothetical protein QF745_02935, partial [Planctomycetota bacterium]|nr:hypothetical protein [Planctomycetota bacterium]